MASPEAAFAGPSWALPRGRGAGSRCRAEGTREIGFVWRKRFRAEPPVSRRPSGPGRPSRTQGGESLLYPSCQSPQVRCLSILPLAIELYGYHIAACIGRQGKSGRENIWRSLPVCLWEDSGMRVAASSGSLAMGGLSAACGAIRAPGVAPSPSPSDLTLPPVAFQSPKHGCPKDCPARPSAGTKYVRAQRR